jgi:catechol 2,3-dioxygenase-like lactoylglutathione lyase family enzyme
MRPQTLIAVSDVEKSSAWYCEVLGAVSGHGGPEYERLVVDDVLVMQLHNLDVDHHHGPFGDPSHPLGNGVAIWFEIDDLEAAAERARTLGATIQTDIHLNPNANHHELWLRDPDNYLVVLASHPLSR